MEVMNNTVCIGCSNKDNLCNLFAPINDEETYADIFKRCFEIEIKTETKFICPQCCKTVIKLDEFVGRIKRNLFGENENNQTFDNIEYVDDYIPLDSVIKEIIPVMETEQGIDAHQVNITASTSYEVPLKSVDGEIEGNFVGDAASERAHDKFYDNDAVADVVDGDIDDRETLVQTLEDTTCIYCGLALEDASLMYAHVTSVHALDPRTGEPLRECPLCSVTLSYPYEDHFHRCHKNQKHLEPKVYQCLFCDNVYTQMKGYFTHIRMKHGVKLTNDKTPKYVPRNRQKCHLCERDFSQKQILNKHLLKVHGYQVEKRKAYECPLCPDKVSYGVYFTDHLLQKHDIPVEVTKLSFDTMDDFLAFKAKTQHENKVRFRKTTASKATIEGVRSHYMCSQSGVYVYQGKGKRLAPERQIYKSGKACPAHMIVTQTANKVLLVYHKTHIGHDACPYYAPRHTLNPKMKGRVSSTVTRAMCDICSMMCDICGMMFDDAETFEQHTLAHNRLYSCQFCGATYPDAESMNLHMAMTCVWF